MANGETNNIHPGNGKNVFTGILSFFTGNPIFSLLSFLLFLGIVLPPRKRKRSYGNHRRSKPARRKKTGTRRRRKKIPRAVGKISGQTKTDLAYGTPKERKKIKSYNKLKRKTRPARVMPERFKNAKKGTPLMTEKMNWMRSKR
jgi:hypothetical protein